MYTGRINQVFALRCQTAPRPNGCSQGCFNYTISLNIVITVPPTHIVGSQTSNGRWCLSSSVVCNAAGRAGRKARQPISHITFAHIVGSRAADTARRASTVTSRYRATPCRYFPNGRLYKEPFLSISQHSGSVT